MAETYLLHEDPRSGNCYKIKLTAALLGIPIETRAYDILKGETRTEDFLAKVNPNGRIPVLQIEKGGGVRFLPESNAACHYLAHGSHLVPTGRFEQAEMLRWMFFEQYSHEPNIATSRFWLSIVGKDNLTSEQRAQLPAKHAAGSDALRLMDEHLADRQFFAGNTLSLSDIALFAYTHVADEGGFDLEHYGHLARWIERIENAPGFLPMT